jgi:hypothetical protein
VITIEQSGRVISLTREESIKLLALIKVAYPTAYKDMDRETKLATVNMWQMSFPTVPYVIMEMAFNSFRLKSKYPPTVAEMVDELRNSYYSAVLNANVAQGMGDSDTYRRCLYVMDHTSRFRDSNDSVNYGGISEAMLSAHEERAMLTEGDTAW